MVAKHNLNPRNVIDALVRGPCSDRLIDIVHARVLEAVDRASVTALPLIRAAGATAKYKEVKRKVSDLICSDLYEVMIEQRRTPRAPSTWKTHSEASWRPSRRTNSSASSTLSLSRTSGNSSSSGASWARLSGYCKHTFYSDVC